MKVGVLALQGAFLEHIKIVEKIGHIAIPIKTPDQLDEIDKLIIPGGESTTISRLLNRYALDKKIVDLYKNKKIPIFGTCAGMILLAKNIEDDDNLKTLGLINIKVKRNAFGRQINSFEAYLDIKGITPPQFRAIFIRAPFIREAGKEVDILSLYKEDIVAAREENLLVSSFHPELGDDTRVHEYFLKNIS